MLKIPFRGYPRPIATWSRDGVKIEHSDKYHIELIERHAILTINGVSKEDTGPYRLLLENELGSDSCVVKIAIRDRPDPPRFLTVENIMEEAVTLSWKPPIVEAGQYITNYIVEKREVGGDWSVCSRTR